MNELQTGATRAFSLLRKLAKDETQPAEEIYELIKLTETMASANLVSQLGAKIDTLSAQLSSMEKSQNAKIDTQSAQLSSMEKSQNAKIDTLTAKYTVVIWAITFAGLVLGAAIIFGG